MQKNILKLRFLLSTVILLFSQATLSDILFTENFEDTNFANRGWYDGTELRLSTVEHLPGSASSAQFFYSQGANVPPSGGAIRRKFTATNEVYISYYVKYSSNWVGSGVDFHPHEFMFLTNLEDDYSGLSNSRLTAYVEQNAGVPVVALQDSQNIDTSNINVDLIGSTEFRAVAGCNGANNSGYTKLDCYPYNNGYYNEIIWKANGVYFQDSPGSYYKNDWHKIEAYFKLNTVANNVGLADGVIRYWYDDELLIDHNNVYFRTGQYPNMLFDKLAIAPYIGVGSPVNQTMWVDNLTVATFKSDIVRPNPPIIQ